MTLALADTIEEDCATRGVAGTGMLIQWTGNQMQKPQIEIRTEFHRPSGSQGPVRALWARDPAGLFGKRFQERKAAGAPTKFLSIGDVRSHPNPWVACCCCTPETNGLAPTKECFQKTSTAASRGCQNQGAPDSSARLLEANQVPGLP